MSWLFSSWIAVAQAGDAVTEPTLDSVFELARRGGFAMIPIALCSVVGLAYVVERVVNLRAGALGSNKLAKSVVDELRSGGPSSALARCESKPTSLTRILAVGLRRAGEPYLDRDQAVGDAASTEMRRLSANLRPLLIVWLIAPLLGLLGTVWGMIRSFGEIATQSGLGKPELLAGGIYQALTTTAAGLAVAIPAIVAYHWLKGRIERFARRVEDAQRDVEEALLADRTA